MVHRPGASPEARPFFGDRVTCGRRATNALVIDLPEVSQDHAVFERRDEGWVVLDCGSRNGTFVESERLPPGVATVLRPNARVRLGTCIVEVGGAAPSVTDTRADVVAAVGSRGATSWERLSERVTGLLHQRFPRNATPPTLEFDDFVSEVMLVVVRDLPGFEPRGPGSFLAWVQTLAQNRLADLWRHHNAQRRAPRTADGQDLDALPDRDAASATQHLHVRELEEIELECVRGLPEHAQEVYLRRRQREVGFDELARELGKGSEIAVRSLFKRTRVLVRECIARKADAFGHGLRDSL